MGPDEKEARRMQELGFHRIVFALPPAEPNVVLPLLDRYAELARKLV